MEGTISFSSTEVSRLSSEVQTAGFALSLVSHGLMKQSLPRYTSREDIQLLCEELSCARRSAFFPLSKDWLRQQH